jgi:hypothetical protein
MKRPKLEDFKPEYTKGLTGIVSVAKKFVKAQDLYIDYLEQLTLTDVVVPKGTFNCGQERAFGEERCKVQCKDCVIEYQDN